MLDLITDAWLPVIRRQSGRCTIAPYAITDAHSTDPVIALDWPRPDFCVAGMELLIGLLATACPPGDARDWLDRWHTPPTPDALAAAFAPLALAFELDGDGPRFMQDYDELVSEAEPVERLLIEAPGDSTTSKNTDLLVRRGRVSTLGRPAAAMALYTFQSWAPAGGAGNRTGLRGGGPLVTLVLPGDAPTLWQALWANVPEGEAAEAIELPRIFPWLATTLTSKGGGVITPDTAHPLQCWWGMPRRIRLDFAGPALCSLTGGADDVSIVSWRQRPHGPNYLAWGEVHPLTPTYQTKPGEERLAQHPQPGGIGYRHWLGLVQPTGAGLRQPARAVTGWRDRQLDITRPGSSWAGRLLVTGFDMDNMKARGFVESTMPLPAVANRAAQERLDAQVERLVQSAGQVASMLRSAVRSALFSAGATVRPNLELLSTVQERLWAATEAAFFATISRPAPEATALHQWHALLRRTALELFDEAAPMEPDVTPLVRQGETVPRLVRARRNLSFALNGFGKDGALLFTTLLLPAAEPRKKKGKAA